jgi:hypothetical protein
MKLLFVCSIFLSLMSTKASAIEVGDWVNETRVIGSLQVPLEIYFDSTSLIEHGSNLGVMKGEKAQFTLTYDKYPSQLADGALTKEAIEQDALKKCASFSNERQQKHLLNQYGKEIDQYQKGYRAFLPPLAVASTIGVDVYSDRVFCTVETRLYPSTQACSTMEQNSDDDVRMVSSKIRRGCAPAFNNILN